MARASFKNIGVAGISVALPKNCYSTEQLATDMDERALKRFVRSTGVKSRYLSIDNQTTSDLCYVAAKELIEKKAINTSDIDAVIFISQNPDYERPSTAIVLQARLGLTKNCMAFDINLGCSGYVYGLYFIAGLIESGAVKNALLLCGEVNRNLPGDLLFGDAGTATLLKNCSGHMDGILKSDGWGYKLIYTPGGGQRHLLGKDGYDEASALPHMDGSGVFEFSISQVPELFKEYLNEFNKKYDDYDYIILHQANKMIIDHIVMKTKMPKEKVPISIDKYANTSSASIPVAIADLHNITGDKKVNLLMAGFGVGLSLGIISAEIDMSCVLPITYTDYVWNEKFGE